MRIRILTLVLGVLLSVAAMTAGRTTAHAAPVYGSTVVSYDVPTTVLDANNLPSHLYLEVSHPTLNGVIVQAPLILTYTPYAVLGRNGDAAHWNSLGYARGTADVIGTGYSGGCWDYGGLKEKRSVKDLIDWIGVQSWNNGKVGMLGGSYDGTTQYAAAVMHPTALKTIVPEAAIDRWYDYAFAGGIRYSDTNEPFGYEGPGTAGDEGLDTPLLFDFGLAVPPPIDNTDPAWAANVKSHMNVCDEIVHTQYGYSTTPDYGQFWLDRDYLKDLPNVTIPVLVASNWGDWNVKQVDGWQAYHALTSSTFARMYMGSRWHGHGTPPGAAYSQTVDRWFAHFLMGANNDIETTLPPVTTASADSSGAASDTYRSGPEPATTPVKLYLAHGGDNNWALSPDASTAPPGSPQASFLSTGQNTESSMTLHPFVDQGYLAFESPVLTRDVRVYGEPSLHLWSTVQRTWVTYTPALLDFNPANYTGSGPATATTNHNAIPSFTRGWLDSRYRSGLATQVGVTPGQSFGEDISLWPSDYIIKAGHRLVLLFSTETADWDIPKAYTPPADPTVLLQYEHSESYLTLPVVGTVSSADDLFNGPVANVPETPMVPLLGLAGLAVAGALLRRHRRPARTEAKR